YLGKYILRRWITDYTVQFLDYPGLWSKIAVCWEGCVVDEYFLLSLRLGNRLARDGQVKYNQWRFHAIYSCFPVFVLTLRADQQNVACALRSSCSIVRIVDFLPLTLCPSPIPLPPLTPASHPPSPRRTPPQ